MADKKKDSGKKSSSKKSKKESSKSKSTEAQDDEVREKVLDRAPSGTGTATGKAKSEREIPKGKDRGAKEPHDEGASPDYFEGGKKPEGAQAEPARFTPTGSIRAGMVASPTGPVPASARARSSEEGEKLLERQKERERESVLGREEGRGAVTEDQLNRMSASEIRAVAHDRGYDLGARGGRHRTRRAFLRAQEEDETLEDSD